MKEKKAIKDSDISIKQVIACGTVFLNDMEEITRYHSWEHCYKKFQEAHLKRNNEEIDELCLNLAFYLASWGMYRGSSFLLCFDYKIHEEAVKEILKKEYNDLWEFNISDNNIQKIKDLEANLKKIYASYREKSKKFRNPEVEIEVKKEVSDTLITKILLGTIGCTPAFDKYFKLALKKCKKDAKIDDLQYLITYYQLNKSEFEKLRQKISEKRKVEYPPMKVIDMCFWQLGKNLDNKKETS